RSLNAIEFAKRVNRRPGPRSPQRDEKRSAGKRESPPSCRAVFLEQDQKALSNKSSSRMSDRTFALSSHDTPHPFRRRIFHVDAGAVLMWALLVAVALVVAPPLFFLVKTSMTVPPSGAAAVTGAPGTFGWGNYIRVLQSSGIDLWAVTLTFAVGS